MMYNKDEILKLLEDAPLTESDIFYDEYNENFMETMGADFSKKFTYSYGATKFVLIPNDENENFVIKIPYTGSSGYDSNYYYNDAATYIDYWSAGTEDREWDYCEAEVIRYQQAAEYGLEKCLAKTEFVGFINGYPIYVQERCKVFSCNENKHSMEELKTTIDICNLWYYNSSIDGNWLTDFRIYYGEETLKKFIDFISSNDWNDLRSDNIGYINNKPVLVDYSGFYD